MTGKPAYEDLEQRIRDLEERLIKDKDEEAILKRKTTAQRLLLDTIDVQVWYLNDAETYGSVNRAHVEFVGRRFQDVAHKKLEEFLPRDVADVYRAGNLQVFGTRRPVHREVWIPNSQGEKRLISITQTPKLNPCGDVEFVVCTGTDITERKLAEEALQESDKKFRVLMENTSVGIYLIQDDKLIYVNPGFEDITGSTLDDMAEIPYWKYIHPDFRETVRQRGIERMRGEAPPQRYEFKFVAKEGQEKWVELSATSLNLWNKQTIMGSIFDITERKLAEQMSRQSEEKFYKIFMTTPECIAITRMHDGLLLDVNKGYEDIVGRKREEVIGLESTYYNFWVDLSERAFMVDELKAGRDVLHREFQFRHSDSSIHTGIYSARPIQIADEACLIFVLQDITDRRRMEEDHRKIEQQLIHSQKMESIGTLAGGIAHDFNNLLMGIQGYTSLSLMNLDPAHLNYERLKRIEEQVQSGADLTRQLLGFARGGRYEVRPTDMNDILGKSSSMFGRTKKEISIHLKFRKDLWIVEVDRGQMEQVFMNLYVNAWQAMPGGGEIYLETENIMLDDEHAHSWTVKPGRHVKISMTDTGTGMDAKTQGRIFDPFFTTKEMGRGTGLGLATVYGIIKGHGGTINVYSELGNGTTFNIYLPASDREVVKEEPATATITRGSETILLVDDENIVMEVSRELLESMGYIVHVAGSGQEALSIYMEKRDEIDLVILDMIMPGISGGETFDRLREINPEINVLLSSGYRITGQAQEILDRGCNGFLQKPFHPDNLSRKVREMLD